MILLQRNNYSTLLTTCYIEKHSIMHLYGVVGLSKQLKKMIVYDLNVDIK